MSAEIICFGEAMVELSAIEDSACRIAIAGDTFNTAVYLARAGHVVSYATAVGSCPFSCKLRDTLKLEGIAQDLVHTIKDRSVGLYAIDVDKTGERSFTYWRSESAVRSLLETSEGASILAEMKQAKTVYLTGVTLSLYTDEYREKIFDMMLSRKEHGQLTVFDGNYRPRNWKSANLARDAITRAISLATWSLPTFDDEAALFGDETPEATAERHKLLGVAEVTVKHGAKGAYVDGAAWVTPRMVITPKDTTGAGDSFNAAYISARLYGQSTKEAALAGHALAGRVLNVPGALLPRDVQ